MTTLLVANRGEIARRIFRTARRMGLRTVAVFSDADARLPFVREADIAVRIGQAARESYLDVDRIVSAARETGADLIHPGCGFLAESTELAIATARAGVRFVGPAPEVLSALRDRARAKDVARRAHVPVLPGHVSEDQSDERFVEAARDIGYPLMVKPVGDGGGIGMQRVRDEGALREALAKARRTASASFAGAPLMLERLVERPRHVEVQLLADAHGGIAALGERDCSIQRRHQKVLEECPAPSLDDAQRKVLADAAVAVARQVGYTGAGTVEFAVDGRGDFFFLSANARLQVEHALTELVWDIDLVEQQLRIALGERLALKEPAPRGHAIEARLYAEDVEAGFLASTGPLLHVRWPDGVRVDAGYDEGCEVTPDSDPLIAKLVAHGPHRKLALAKLDEALAGTEILGVRTNLRFLCAVLGHPEFAHGKADTEFVRREYERLVPDVGVPSPEALALASALLADAAGGRGPYDVEGHHVARSPGEAHGWTVDGTPAAAARAGDTVWVTLGGRTFEIGAAAASQR